MLMILASGRKDGEATTKSSVQDDGITAGLTDWRVGYEHYLQEKSRQKKINTQDFARHAIWI